MNPMLMASKLRIDQNHETKPHCSQNSSTGRNKMEIKKDLHGRKYVENGLNFLSPPSTPRLCAYDLTPNINQAFCRVWTWKNVDLFLFHSLLVLLSKLIFPGFYNWKRNEFEIFCNITLFSKIKSH